MSIENANKPKKKTHTSSKVKAKYNKKAYDNIMVRVHKGQKEIIQSRAAQLNKSVNGYINDLIKEDLKK